MSSPDQLLGSSGWWWSHRKGCLNACLAVSWSMHHHHLLHAPANNPTCSTTLDQLAAPGSLAVLRANLVGAGSMAAEAVARLGSNKTCTGSPGCLGWPGWPGRSRIAGGGNVGWSIMGTVRHPDLWNAKKTVYLLSLGNNNTNDVVEGTNFVGVTKVLGCFFSNLNTANSKVQHMRYNVLVFS